MYKFYTNYNKFYNKFYTSSTQVLRLSQCVAVFTISLCRKVRATSTQHNNR